MYYMHLPTNINQYFASNLHLNEGVIFHCEFRTTKSWRGFHGIQPVNLAIGEWQLCHRFKVILFFFVVALPHETDKMDMIAPHPACVLACFHLGSGTVSHCFAPMGLPSLHTNGLRSSESDEEVLIARLRASLAAPWRDELDECYLWYATPMMSN
jgi:hypothetical protein